MICSMIKMKFFFLFLKLIPLSSHTDEVQYVKFDLKGQYMVSTGRDRTLRIWS